MSDESRLELDKIPLKRLIGMLSVGQLWAVIVALFTVIVVAFSFGVFINELRLNTYESRLTEAENRGDELQNQNERYVVQIEFLERSVNYLNARTRGRENELNNDSDDRVALTSELFATTLQRLYKNGDTTLQIADGYEFDESDPDNHKIKFHKINPPSSKSYDIPQDVKGDFIYGLP
ncbi:MAG: hypothetical protein ACE5Q6_09480 [Dehalococcoidia bacterium]